MFGFGFPIDEMQVLDAQDTQVGWRTHHGGQIDGQTGGVVRIGLEHLPADIQGLSCIILKGSGDATE